ncbi:dihydrofolate reductase family protein [Actinomadura barringtoniae]|uniref:Dihydrofolate reductase family protein n=1 Tax=Actinomadura barringtoniae TaxID=1427535 RepID=A0A939PC18_9ACTN|nr:dihydrofolate reductase family protein [Actinomadura barringtoniae]MBO2450057.1 dihydrofolate reductase family protein [Actinomadura barringtoniae]
MGKVIVMEFITLDGVIDDPDGSGGTAFGGWAFRHGPEAVAGDKFQLGTILDTGVMLLGRVTWQLFTHIWPGREDEFSQKMNAIPKLVASRTLDDLSAWNNSALLDGDLVEAVTKISRDQDIVITGSAAIVEALRERDLVDQYRLMVFPTVVGQGRRLFDGAGPIELELTKAEQAGAGVRMVYDRPEGDRR